MARRLASDNQDMYRVVLTVTHLREDQEPRVFTSTYGPYNNIGTAKAQITSAKNTAYTITRDRGRESTWHLLDGFEWLERTVEGHVEKANVTWERV